MKNCLLYFGVILFFLLPGRMIAQTWKASEPSEGTFFFYNVNRQTLVYGSNYQGKSASLTDKGGVQLTLVSSGETGKYYISTDPVYQGKYLGIDGTYVYLDQEKTTTWQFVPVEGEPDAYYIMGTRNSQNRYLVAHASDATRIVLSSTAPNSPKAYWKLVTRENLIANLSEATSDHPLDATWALQNANLGRTTDASF